MSVPDRQREELAAALAARRELGDDYDQAVAESFLDRVEAGIDNRIDARLAQLGRREADRVERAREPSAARDHQFWLGVISLGVGIPLSGVGGSLGDLPGLVITWLGIVGVNVAHALGQRRRDG
jgi:hypothetical protein